MTTLVVIGPVCDNHTVRVELWHDAGDIGITRSMWDVKEKETKAFYIYAGNSATIVETNNDKPFDKYSKEDYIRDELEPIH